MIALEGVSKVYVNLVRTRRVEALADFSVSVAPGEVFGVAGPNGAGKSTMLSIVLGYLNPSSGHASIDGQHPRHYIERHGVAYLTELVAIPPRWTAESALRRFASLSGLSGTVARDRVNAAIDLLGLDDHRNKQVRQLSKGNLQRLGLAQSLLADSDLVIFDEPTHGLDPVWSQKFRDVVSQLRRPTRTIIIASHNLDELERLTDRVAILSKGRLQRIVASGSVRAEGGTYRITIAGPSVSIAEIFPGASPVDGRLNEFRVSGSLAELNQRLVSLLASGLIVTSFAPEESRLESEFRSAVGEGRS
ncbi:MAG: ABC transporter ATP-binding protein [Gemmatimonadota bacterium]